VPAESASSARRARGSRPSRKNPPCSPIATSVPTASKTAMKRKISTAGRARGWSAPATSSCKQRRRERRRRRDEGPANARCPRLHATAVARPMPQSSAPARRARAARPS
jgi:hypothetical protein